jgi:hypothetical protein
LKIDSFSPPEFQTTAIIVGDRVGFEQKWIKISGERRVAHNGKMGHNSRPHQKQGPRISLSLAIRKWASRDLFSRDVIERPLQRTREEFAAIHPTCFGDPIAIY